MSNCCFRWQGMTWRSQFHGRCAAVCGLMVLIVSVGCGGGYSGPARGAVQGRVMIDGAPVEEGVIAFIPAAGTSGPSAGGVVLAGNYSIPEEKGPVVGTYRVEIRASRKTDRKIEAGSPFPPGTMIDETIDLIPAKYNSASELEHEIVAGANTLDFELQTK
jgi:hypothetical protein